MISIMVYSIYPFNHVIFDFLFVGLKVIAEITETVLQLHEHIVSYGMFLMSPYSALDMKYILQQSCSGAQKGLGIHY